MQADDEAADYLRAFLAAMGGSRLERASMLPLLWDMVELDYDPVSAYIDIGELFADGTKSLIDAMARDLDVRLRTVVTAIAHEADGVTVTLEGGDELRARAAVHALPLNCWADVPGDARARPREAGGRRERSRRRGLEGPGGHHGRSGDVPGDGMGHARQRRVHHEVPATTGSCSWGSRSSRASTWAIATPWPPRSARTCPRPTVVQTAGHDWVADPFAKGTWLAIPPGWFSDGTFDALAEPEGRLVFAGSDIATEGAGWIEGAVASGRAAAARCRHLLD